MWHPDMCRLPEQGLCSDLVPSHFPPILQPLEEEIGALLEGGLWSAKTFDFSQNARAFQSTSLVLVLLSAHLHP